jgi:hypothetical protein
MDAQVKFFKEHLADTKYTSSKDNYLTYGKWLLQDRQIRVVDEEASHASHASQFAAVFGGMGVWEPEVQDLVGAPRRLASKSAELKRLTKGYAPATTTFSVWTLCKALRDFSTPTQGHAVLPAPESH